jgi:hypothetical protein
MLTTLLTTAECTAKCSGDRADRFSRCSGDRAERLSSSVTCLTKSLARLASSLTGYLTRVVSSLSSLTSLRLWRHLHAELLHSIGVLLPLGFQLLDRLLSALKLIVSVSHSFRYLLTELLHHLIYVWNPDSAHV